jgi:hypothetical protein
MLTLNQYDQEVCNLASIWWPLNYVSTVCGRYNTQGTPAVDLAIDAGSFDDVPLHLNARTLTNVQSTLTLQNRHEKERQSTLSTSKPSFVQGALSVQDLVVKIASTVSSFARGLVVGNWNTISKLQLPSSIYIDALLTGSTSTVAAAASKYRLLTEEEAKQTYWSFVLFVDEPCNLLFESDLYVIIGSNEQKLNVADYQYTLRQSSVVHEGWSTQVTIVSKKMLSQFFVRSQLQKLVVKVIGLQDRPARRINLFRQLQQLRVDYDYTPAVDGKQIHIGRFSPSVQECLQPQYQQQIAQVLYDQQLFFHDPASRPYRMSYGEFGCALSHLLAYVGMKGKHKMLMMMEDDAMITHPHEWLHQLRCLPAQEMWDACYYQNESVWYCPQTLHPINETYNLNIQKGVNCTHCYVLSARGVDKVLGHLLSTSEKYYKPTALSNASPPMFVNFPADDVLSNYTAAGGLLIIAPGFRPVSTQKADSDIWSIYKPNESRQTVEWQKPFVPPQRLVLSEIANWSRLGNQMFMYAVATIAAWKKQARVSFPKFRLDAKHITLMNAFKRMVYDVHAAAPPNAKLLEDREFVYKPQIVDESKLPAQITSLEGYFQNAEYFQNNEYVVYEMFEFLPAVDISATRYITKYTSVGATPISVHLRLKDIAADPTEFIYSIYTPSHLQRAVGLLPLADIVSPVLLVHSSDFVECKRTYDVAMKELGIPYVYVEESEAKSLAIMSKCDYHVISASTYSWWGAWLADQRLKFLSRGEKKAAVVVPKPWYNPKVPRTANTFVEGLYVEGWTVVDL